MEQNIKRRAVRVILAALALGVAGVLLLVLRPPCLILQTTGLYCGACGFTRMVDELLQGHWRTAFWENPYLFTCLPLAAAYLAGEAVCYLRGKLPLWKRRWMATVWIAVIAVGVLFTVLRNLPGFQGLRPQ